MFSTEGILKEIIKEKQEETNSTFSFIGCIGAFTELPEASEKHNGKICIVDIKDGYEMYVCINSCWKKIETTLITT